MLWHASPVSGLTTLTPHVSTHGVACVYAAKVRACALLFGAKQDDFDFKIDFANGVTQVYECCPGTFERVYGEKPCSLYALPEEGFLPGPPGCSDELMSTGPVKVLSEERIPDLLFALRAAESRGECGLHVYEHSTAYRAMISAHAAERLLRFGILNGPIRDPRLTGPYARLVRQLRDAVSGKYLR